MKSSLTDDAPIVYQQLVFNEATLHGTALLTELQNRFEIGVRTGAKNSNFLEVLNTSVGT